MYFFTEIPLLKVGSNAKIMMVERKPLYSARKRPGFGARTRTKEILLQERSFIVLD